MSQSRTEPLSLSLGLPRPPLLKELGSREVRLSKTYIPSEKNFLLRAFSESLGGGS